MRTGYAVVLCSLLVSGCSDGLPTVPFRDGEVGELDADVDPHLPLELDGVEPTHGSFAGGDRVVLRGVGLTPATVAVTFGGVPATDVRWVDAHRIEATTPAGAPGPVDVTVEGAGSRVVLAGGYLYDALQVTPSAGSEGGGAWVAIRAFGAPLDPAVTVTFADAPCTGVTIEAPDQIRCFTPPGEIGPATVTLASSTDTRRAIDAFTYEDPTLAGGGTGGGALAGTLEVAVTGTHGPLAGATVLAGPSATSLQTAHTDARGLVTFAGPTFASGPIDVHVPGTCGNVVSYLGIAARRLTIVTSDSCLPATGTPAMPVFISGHVDARGWAGVPAGARVVRVLVVGYESSTIMGTRDRIADGESADYRVAVAPGTYAVVALAGTEDASGDLSAFRMGIARDVVVRSDRGGIDLATDLALDRAFTVTVHPPDDGGTDTVSASLRIGEGTLTRALDTMGTYQSLDLALGAAPTFVVGAEPALTGVLSDARFDVVALHQLGSGSSTRVAYGVTGDAATLDGFLGVPSIVTPAAGGAYADQLAWTTGVGVDASVTEIRLGIDHFSWTLMARGDVTSVTLPTLDTLGIAPSIRALSVSITRLAGDAFDYDRSSETEMWTLTTRAECSASFTW